MLWSIVDVARSAGVTARTLRHFDAIGLLRPTAFGSDGYRRYDEHALLRLQRVLLLRALGLPLKEIGAVLDAEQDELATLREHHGRLLAERDRLTRMAATVGRTITRLERNEPMSETDAAELFDGFDEQAYAEEARQRWPEQAASSAARVAAMSEDDKAALKDEYVAEMHRMAALMAAGEPVEADAVQREIGALHARVATMWTPTAQAFAGLGATYVDDDRFRVVYERVAPGLAAYYRDAMTHYAATRLG